MNELTISLLTGFLLVLSYFAHGELKYVSTPNETIQATTSVERDLGIEDNEDSLESDSEAEYEVEKTEKRDIEIEDESDGDREVEVKTRKKYKMKLKKNDELDAEQENKKFSKSTKLNATLVDEPTETVDNREDSYEEQNYETSPYLQESNEENVSQAPPSLKKTKLSKTKAKRKYLEDRSADIVELKLEEDRLKQELDRASKLFNNLDETPKESAPEQANVVVNNQATSSVEPILVEQPAITSTDFENESSSTSDMETVKVDNLNKRANVSVSAGMSDLESVAGFDIDPKMMWGLSAGYLPNDYVEVDIGYNYALYDASPTTGLFSESIFFRSNDYSIEQHVIQLNTKVFALPVGTIIRPYIGAGLSYIINSMDFTSEDHIGRKYSRSRDVRSFAGQALAGLDFQLTDSFSIGADAKYFNVFSSDSDTNNYSAGSGYGPYGSYSAFNVNQEERAREENIGESNFYQFSGGVKFHF